MKKFVYLIVGAMFILSPFAAFAIESMDAGSMKAATGQAGVTIGIDDVILYQNSGDITYTDNDGTGDADDAGIKLTGAESLMVINAIDDDGTDADTNDDTVGAILTHKVNYDSTLTANGLTLTPSALTIDIGTCDVLTQITGGTMAGVAIGLPTLEIYDALGAKTQIISLVDSGAANNNAEFIRITQTGSTMALLGGVLEIAPH